MGTTVTPSVRSYVKLASNLHGYCSYVTGFSTDFGRVGPSGR